MATAVFLSALAVPIMTEGHNDIEFDDSKMRTARLTNLLNMSQPPTRSSLIEDAVCL